MKTSNIEICITFCYQLNVQVASGFKGKEPVQKGDWERGVK
jgi:hypothetical protein